MVENETKTEKECSRSTLVYEQYVASCNNKYLVKMYRIFDRPVQKSMYCMDQPSIGANPVRCQLNRTFFFLSPFAPENLVAQDGFGLSVPRQLPYSPQPRLSGLVWCLLTGCSRSSRFPRRRSSIPSTQLRTDCVHSRESVGTSLSCCSSNERCLFMKSHDYFLCSPLLVYSYPTPTSVFTVPYVRMHARMYRLN